MSQNYLDMHVHQLEETVERLTEKVRSLEKENLEMRVALEEAGIDQADVKISETEYICLQQLRMIKEWSEQRPLAKEEVAIVDLLHKNLLMARNIPISKKSKEKPKSAAELLKIVEGK